MAIEACIIISNGLARHWRLDCDGVRKVPFGSCIEEAADVENNHNSEGEPNAQLLEALQCFVDAHGYF